jgi:hypothetical protein
MPKVDLSQFNRQIVQAGKVFNTLPDYALRTMQAYTPVRTGNARRNTRQIGNSIVANYPYAQRLEDNHSPQTQGQGIIAPTERAIQKEIDRRLKGI